MFVQSSTKTHQMVQKTAFYLTNPTDHCINVYAPIRVTPLALRAIPCDREEVPSSLFGFILYSFLSYRTCSSYHFIILITTLIYFRFTVIEDSLK